MIIALVVAFTVGQVPVPCGSKSNPCYVQPALAQTGVIIDGNSVVDGQITVNQLRERSDAGGPDCLQLCGRAAAHELEWSCNCTECATAISTAKTCAARLDDYKGMFAQLTFAGLLVWLCAGVMFALSHVDKIAAAWRRSELPARILVRALLYFIAAFGGTALAVGLFR